MMHGVFQFFVFKIFEVKYKREIKQMIKSGIPEEKLITFTFHKNIEVSSTPEFKWTKKNEFRYQGEMYDIISQEIKDDSIVYRVFHDLKESQLFTNLDKHINGFVEKNPSRMNDLLTIINSLSKFYSPVQTVELKNNFILKDFANDISFVPLEGEKLLLTPPPKS